VSRRLPLVVLLAVACKPLPPRGPAPAVQARALPPLVLQLDEGGPEACLEASVRAGSAFDPIGGEGTASLLAHALVGHARAAAGPDAPPLDVDVGREDVTFRLRCPADRASACASLLADAVTVPDFDEADVERARQDALAALATRPVGELADDVLDLWIFDAHPYGHPVRGRTGVLGTIDTLALRRFFATHYVRAATVVGVAGGAPLADAHALEARTGALGDAMRPDLPLFHAVPADGRELLVVDAPTPTVALRLGRAFDPGPDGDPVALLVGAEALAVRTGLDVALVGLDPAPGTHRRRPFLRVRLPDVPPAEAPAALRGALARLVEAIDGGLDAASVDAARERLAARAAREAGDPCARLAAAVDAVATGRPDAAEHLAEAVGRVSPEAASAAVAEHLDPGSLRIVAVGEGGRALGLALAGEGTDAPLGVTTIAVREASGIYR
jgi:predicted Zn-dependent peptidase